MIYGDLKKSTARALGDHRVAVRQSAVTTGTIAVPEMKKKNYNMKLAARGESSTFREKISSLKGIVGMLLLFVLILGGILSGLLILIGVGIPIRFISNSRVRFFLDKKCYTK